ncbi:hypothetical protein [Streptomyces sp. NPDC057909]|uniref:hypothetical protein n=1 Tax=Streptomyces sp. NPDC057909 TaxID=3346277 RepID=UPI0036E4370F
MLALVIVGRHQADERISQKIGEHGRRFPRVVIHSMRSSRTAPSGIYAISGTLEKSLVEIFMPDHAGRPEQARQRLLAMGGDEDEEGEAAQGASREPSSDDISG